MSSLSSLRLAKCALLALPFAPVLVWRSFYYHYVTTEAFFILAFAEVAILCSLWFFSKHPQAWKPLSAAEKCFLAFVAILLLTSLFGLNPSLSFWSSFDRMTGGIMWLHLLAIFLIAPRVFQDLLDWQRFFIVSTTVGVLVSSFHLLSFLELTDMPLFIQRDSTIGNSSIFGVYILFQIFLSFLLIATTQGWMRLYSYITAAFFIVTLFSSEALAVIWSFGGSIVLLCALMMIVRVRKHGMGRSSGFVIIGLLVSLFLLLSGLLFQSGSWVREMFIREASGARFVVWDIAWQGITERPVLGWGLENFSSVFLKYYNPCFGSPSCGSEIWFDRAHNKLLDVWSESGVVGVSLYLALFLTVLYGLWRGYRHGRIDGVVASIITSALAAYFVQNLTGLDVSLTLLFWVFLLAFANTIAFQQTKKYVTTRHVHPLLPAFGSILLFLAFFFFVVQPLRGNLAIHQWFVASDMEERFTAFDRATRISPIGIDLRRWYLARQSAGGLWIAFMTGESIDSNALRELLLSEERLESTIQKTPNPLLSYLHLGLVYHTHAKFFDENKFQDAERSLTQAITLNPRHQQPLWALAAVYLEQGKVEEALALTQRALEFDPNVLESHKQRLIVTKFSGDQALFDQYAKEALALSSGLGSYVELVRSADLTQKRTQLIFELY